MLKWTSKGSLNAQDRVNHSLPTTSWHALEATGERDVNLVNKILAKSTAGQELGQVDLQSFERPFSNNFVADVSTVAKRNLPLASAPNSPLSNAKDFFRHQSISLPASPERGLNPSAILDGKKSKHGVFKKLKKLFRKPKSKDLKSTPQASPTLKTQRTHAVIGRTMSSLDGTNVAPKTRLIRLIESKKAQRKSKRSLLEKKYADESESYSSDDNRVQNHSFAPDAKHFDIFTSPCPSLNSLVAQLSLDAPEYEDAVSVSSTGSKPRCNVPNSNSFSTEQDFLVADHVFPAMHQDMENGRTTPNMASLHQIDQSLSAQGIKKKHYSASDSNSASFIDESEKNSGIETEKFSDKTVINANSVPIFNRNSLDTGLGAQSSQAESEFSDQSPGLELHGSDSGSSLHKFAKILEVIKQSGSFEKVKVMPTSPDKIIQIKSQLTPVSITNSNSTDTVQMASSLDQWSWREESQYMSPIVQDNSSDDQYESDQKEAYSPLQPPYTRNNNNGHHTYHHDMVTTPYMMDSTVREAGFISYGDAGIEPSRVSSLVKSFQENEKMASLRRPPIQAYTRVDQLQDTGLVCVRDTVKRISSAGREDRGAAQNENSHFSQARPEEKDQVSEHEQEDFELSRNAPTLVVRDDAKVTLKTPKVVRFLLQDEAINKTDISVEKYEYDVDSGDDNESCSASDVAEYDTASSFNSSNPFSEDIPSDSTMTFASDTKAFCSDLSDTLSGASDPKELPSENSGKQEPSLGSVVQLVCDSFMTSLPNNDAGRQSAWDIDSQTDDTKTHGGVQEVYTDLPRPCESRSSLTKNLLQPKTDTVLHSVDVRVEQADADKRASFEVCKVSEQSDDDKMASFEVCKVSEQSDDDKMASFEVCMVSEKADADKLSSLDAKANNSEVAISPTLDNDALTTTKSKLLGESVCVSPGEYEECITDVRAPNLMLIHDFSPVEPVTSSVDKSSLESPHAIVTYDISPLEKQLSDCRAINMESIVSNGLEKACNENVDPCKETENPMSIMSNFAVYDNKTRILSTEESDGTEDDTPDFPPRVNMIESTIKKKRVSFQLESPSPDWSSQSDDIAIMEMSLQYDDKSADEAGNEISTDVSSKESSIKSNEVQDLECTVPVTSNSVDDVSWWGNEILEDIEFFHDRAFQEDPGTIKEQCHTEVAIDSVQQIQPNSTTPSNDSLLQYETTENSHNDDSNSEQEKFLTLSKFLSTESAFLKATDQNSDLKTTPGQPGDDISLVSTEDDVELKFVQDASPGALEGHDLLPIQELNSENEHVVTDESGRLSRDSVSRVEVPSDDKRNTESEINTLTYNVPSDDVDKKRAWWDGPSPAKSDGSSIMNLDLDGDVSSSLSDCLSRGNSLVDVDSDRTSSSQVDRLDQKGNNLVLELRPFGSNTIELLSAPDSSTFGSPILNVSKERVMNSGSKLKQNRNSSIISLPADTKHESHVSSFLTDGKYGRSILDKDTTLKVTTNKLKPESRISGKPSKARIQSLVDQNMADGRLSEAEEDLDSSSLDYVHRVTTKNVTNERGREERKSRSGVGASGNKMSLWIKSAGTNSGKVVTDLSSPPKMTSYDQGVDKRGQRKSVDSIYSQSFTDQYLGNWGENGSGDSEFSVSSASFRAESLIQEESLTAADTVLREYQRKEPRSKRKSTETKSDFLDSPRTISSVSTSIPGEFTSSPSDTDHPWEQSHYLDQNDLTAGLRSHKMRTFAQAVGERFEGMKSEKHRFERSQLSRATNPIVSLTHTCLQETAQPVLENSDSDSYTALGNRKSSLTEKTASKNAPNTGKSHVTDLSQGRTHGPTAEIFPSETMKKDSIHEPEDTTHSSPADNYDTQHGGHSRRHEHPSTNSTDQQYSSVRSSHPPTNMSNAPRFGGRVQQGDFKPPQAPSQTGQVPRKSKSKLEHQPGEWLFIATFFVFQLLMHWLYAS